MLPGSDWTSTFVVKDTGGTIRGIQSDDLSVRLRAEKVSDHVWSCQASGTLTTTPGPFVIPIVLSVTSVKHLSEPVVDTQTIQVRVSGIIKSPDRGMVNQAVPTDAR
jgi:hypothetical protein